jgi:cytochrome P450
MRRNLVVEKLPYLNAVIDETLRLYGAAPRSLLRQTPKREYVIH